MANQIQVAGAQHEQYLKVKLVIANAVDISIGNLITYESLTAIRMAAANKEDFLAGVACEKKVSGDGNLTLDVHRKPVIWIDATSATYTIGQEVKWTSTDTVVDSGSATGLGKIVALPNGGTSETATSVCILLFTYKFWETGTA